MQGFSQLGLDVEVALLVTGVSDSYIAAGFGNPTSRSRLLVIGKKETSVMAS